jgi:hypothetical protein
MSLRLRRPLPAVALALALFLAGACGNTEVPAEPTPAARPLVLNDPDRTSAAAAESPEGPGALVLTDIEGATHGTLSATDTADPAALFFVRTDCPISNQYGPEIRRICADYGGEGARCLLVYTDPNATAHDIRQHTEDYGHTLAAIADPGHRIVALAGATVTPEVAVFSDGEIAYRGRIDNLYADLGRPRRVVTEHDLRDALDDLAANRSVATPRTQATGCFIE